MSLFGNKSKKAVGSKVSKNVANKQYRNASNRTKSRYYEKDKSDYYNVRLSKNDMQFVYDALKSIENIDVEEYCIALDNNDDKRANYKLQDLHRNEAIRLSMAEKLINKKQFYRKK